MDQERLRSEPETATSSMERYINAEMIRPADEPRSSPEPGSELEPPAGLTHACTNTSSLECQQCTSDDEKSVSSSSTSRNTAQEHSTNHCDHEKSLPRDVVCSDFPKAYRQQKVIAEVVADYANHCPIPDPTKRPPPPKLRLRQVSGSRFRPRQRSMKLSSPLPPLPLMLDTPSTSSDTVGASSYVDFPRVDPKVSDKNVMRGLHIVTAAACDEDVDKWIEDITGSGVRHFLSDLSAFEGLGFNALATVARRAAEQRREQFRTWEDLRERRLEEKLEAFDGKVDQSPSSRGVDNGDSMDRKIGLAAGDVSVDLRKDLRTAEKEVASGMGNRKGK